MSDLIPMSESANFDLILRQAEILANSTIIPAAYRRKAPDIVAAGLAGRAYGWDVMTSMRQFHVIEGTASLRPESMLGLVRQAGHSVTVETHPEGAIAHGTRSDTGDEHSASLCEAALVHTRTALIGLLVGATEGTPVGLFVGAAEGESVGAH